MEGAKESKNFSTLILVRSSVGLLDLLKNYKNQRKQVQCTILVQNCACGFSPKRSES